MAKAAILNMHTKVEAGKSAMELVAYLGRNGAQSVTVEWGPNMKPLALSFAVEVNGMRVPFRLPANVHGVYGVLQRSAPRAFCTMAHAERVAWRILKDWTEAQIALVNCGQAEIAEVFMPYYVTPSGESAYRAFLSAGPQVLALGSGK